MSYPDQYLKDAHRFSFANREMDTLIGDASETPLSKEFLMAMNNEIFGSDSYAEGKVYESFAELVEDHLKKQGSSQFLSIHHGS